MRPQTAARRILCLWFPDWPIQRLVAAPAKGSSAERNPREQGQRAKDDADCGILLLTQRTARGEFVRYLNPLAHRRGIRSGMPLAEAQSLIYPRDTHQIAAIQPLEDLQALGELALELERFSFCIGLEEADPPECLLMEVTGIAHFFGGEIALANQLQRDLRRRQLEGRIGVADSVGSAWAVAHCLARPQRPLVLAVGHHTPLYPLPIEGLRLEPKVVEKLRRLGIETIGQLLALDRGELAGRLGKGVLLRLDQLTGRCEQPITPCPAPPRYQARQRFEFGVTHPQAIEQIAANLLGRVLGQLQPQRLGLQRLICQLTLEDREVLEVSLRLCQPLADARQLGELLRHQFERLRLGAPLLCLEMEALEVFSLQTLQHDLFGEGSHDRARQFGALLNRLSSRLGEEAVVYPQAVADPVPERSIRLVPVTEGRPKTANSTLQNLLPLDRPTVLFERPQRVEVIALIPDGPPVVVYWQGTRWDIAGCWGPERIESGWWHTPYVRRDYYRVETTSGRWLWLFRRLQDQQWFWHGEMM